MTAAATRVGTLIVETTPVADIAGLIPLLEPRRPLLWSRRGDGIAGLGEALRLSFSGAARIHDAAAAWREIADAASVVDPVGVPGTGLIAFGSFAFADDSSAESVLIVPSLIVGRREGRAWVTTIRLAGDADAAPAVLPPAHDFGPEFRITLLPGSQSAGDYSGAVSTALARIEAGEVAKVVLSRELRAQVPAEADLRRPLAELAAGYPDCWTFAVDGFVGASPETLVQVTGREVFARVLAGTAARGTDADHDRAAAGALADSEKDGAEHAFAVSSVHDALAPHTAKLATGERFTLKLPNLWHLATDVSGTLADGSSSLDLVAALHPTAAVAGSPRAAAVALIEELEPFDRGRYAGPVGWVGADGAGEWAVALRSAQLDASGELTAFAGAGIVNGSDPVLELAETTMKFRPIVDAFG